MPNKYISEIGVKNILKYEYHGEDRSYYYKNFLSPLATYLVQFMPYWLAPNLITLLGLMANIVAAILVRYTKYMLNEFAF